MANPELTRQPSSIDEKARSLTRALHTTPQRPSAARSMARGLGWFGIGLGVLELVATRPLARAVGLRGHETLLRAYGLREIANGVGILTARESATATAWTGARLAGDALDLAALAGAAISPKPRHASPLLAMFAVAGVALLDAACTRALQHEAHAAGQVTDYSDRTGLGDAPEAMRGAALATFEQPPDMRVSSTTGGGVMVH